MLLFKKGHLEPTPSTPFSLFPYMMCSLANPDEESAIMSLVYVIHTISYIMTHRDEHRQRVTHMFMCVNVHINIYCWGFVCCF